MKEIQESISTTQNSSKISPLLLANSFCRQVHENDSDNQDSILQYIIFYIFTYFELGEAKLSDDFVLFS